ncbi:hypothetical protein INT43_001430 [Umbelopsis isabellina]|uniref:FAD-binding domain-containing protein n=1 Tax=Mortierella isabellina TaxID=91625 RepID=A0A8H7U9Z3_MORIS|nr:hypothetical protein INT43_001430 [Umbelopsis isabellina]
MSLKILICGGGCGGPALAYWLARSGHQVTIVERFPVLRASGAQIDIRAQGIETIKRMGLLDIIRSKVVNEPGVSIVDAQNKPIATFMANKSGQGAQTFTSEYEIMRGDLVRVLYDATKDNVKYIFGITVESFDQHEDKVLVHFSDGRTGTFDLLVGADGQGSRIRKAILPPAAPEPYMRVGIYMAYYFVPRTEADDSMCRSYLCPGRRMIVSRSHNDTEIQVYLIFEDDAEDIRSIPRAGVDQQKEFWTQKFSNAGWQADRFLEGMKTTENFYCQEIVQVQTDTWYKGRVVLLGDAGYCPSPFTAMGTTASFVGAYVLAGELNRHAQNLPQALANYDMILRPFINEIQDLNRPLLRLMFPKSQIGISIFHWIAWFFYYTGIYNLMARFSKEERGGWNLPDYSELKQCEQ